MKHQFNNGYIRSVESLFLAKGISFKLTSPGTYLLANKYYMTLSGSWRQKGKHTWYRYGGYKCVPALLDKLFGDIVEE